MACCNCCENTLNLGCINSCDAVFDTGIIVDFISMGVYILQLNFGDRIIYYSFNAPEFSNVFFQMTNLNENYTYTGQVINPQGEIVNFLVNGIEYDCIEFSTKIGLSNNTINL